MAKVKINPIERLQNFVWHFDFDENGCPHKRFPKLKTRRHGNPRNQFERHFPENSSQKKQTHQPLFFYSIGKPTTVSRMRFLSKHEGTLKVLNDGIITVEFIQKNKKYKTKNCYAPTLQRSDKNSETKESFYDALNHTMQKKTEIPCENLHW